MAKCLRQIKNPKKKMEFPTPKNIHELEPVFDPLAFAEAVENA